MRLIDADRFLEYMEEKCDSTMQLDLIILAIVSEALKEQQTAYDVDNVIKRLNNLKNEYKERRKNTYCMETETDNCDRCRANHYLDARLGAVDCAIEIVKQFGVRKDVE